MAVRLVSLGGPAAQLDADGVVLDVNAIADGEVLVRSGATITSTPLYGTQIATAPSPSSVALQGDTHRQTWVEIPGTRVGAHTILPPVTYYEIDALIVRRAAAVSGTIGLRIVREISAGSPFSVRSWRIAPETCTNGLVLATEGIPSTTWGEGECHQLRGTFRQPLGGSVAVNDTWLECAYDGPITTATVVGNVHVPRFWIVGGG